MSRSLILLTLVSMIHLPAPASAADNLAEYVRALGEAGGFSGCVLLATQWERQQSHCTGHQADGRPLTLSSPFQIASISKHFTAVAAMRLVEDEVLALDAPITRWLPELTSFGQTTLRHLLNNTGGIPNHDRFPRYAAGRDAPISDTALLTMIDGAGPRFPSGERYEYSNFGWRLAALIIERASGKTFPRYLHDTLFEPLGLKDTLALGEDDYRAHHGFDPAGANGWTAVITAHPDWNEGAGTIVSTANDMLRWSRMLSQGEVLSEASYESLTTPVLEDYAMGLWVSRGEDDIAIGHDGRFTGFAADLQYRRSGRAFALVLSNQQSTLAEALREDLQHALDGEPMGDPRRHVPPIAAVPLAGDAHLLQGRYPLGPDFFLRIAKRGDRLFAAGLWGDLAELVPLDERRYQVRVLNAQLAFSLGENRWPAVSWNGSPPFPREHARGGDGEDH